MIRYAIVGSGMMGLEHIANIVNIPNATVSALVDTHKPSIDLARSVLGDQGDCVVLDDYRELVTGDLCDCVVIATPNMTHCEILGGLLESGLHILTEKPLCTTVDDCRSVINKYQANLERYPNRVVWVAMEYRYMPPIARLLAEVAQGRVGNLKMLAIREHRYPFLSKVNDWNRFNRNSGGTLVEKCCHFFDLMRLICASEPTKIMASGGQDVNHLDEIYNGETPDILDNAYVVVEFESGARALLDLCMFAEATYNQEEIVATGDKGKVEALIPENVIRIGVRGEHFVGNVSVEEVSNSRVAYEGFHHGSSYLQHRDFLSAIETGTAPVVSLQDGMAAVVMGIGAQMSIELGRPVSYQEVLNL